jgi:hypothetical protein
MPFIAYPPPSTDNLSLNEIQDAVQANFLFWRRGNQSYFTASQVSKVQFDHEALY